MLYTLFGMGDPDRARPILLQCFGRAILPYADKAWACADLTDRFALCDRAILDRKVVSAHHASTVIIAGRHETVFTSAFLLKLPIPASAVVRAWSPAERPLQLRPSVHLSDLIQPPLGGASPQG